MVFSAVFFYTEDSFICKCIPIALQSSIYSYIFELICKTEIVELLYIDGLVQERCNFIANALELCLSCTNPSF